jgi:hypothetical protein
MCCRSVPAGAAARQALRIANELRLRRTDFVTKLPRWQEPKPRRAVEIRAGRIARKRAAAGASRVPRCGQRQVRRGDKMISSVEAGPAIREVDRFENGVAWGAIAGGAVTSAALTLILIAIGAGVGFSSVSPWSGEGVSATTFKVATGIYLLVVAVMASSVGGYLAARLRTRWINLHNNEIFFRDTAHGLITWAFATVISATVMAAAASHIVSGIGQAASAAAAHAGPIDFAVDSLFRPEPSATNPAAPPGASAVSEPARAEVTRMLVNDFRNGTVNPADQAYIARVISARTGLSQADAEKRVAEVVTATRQALDAARKAAAQFALWLAAALLLGAFGSALAAVEGGQLRDGTWDERRLTPRPL